MEHKGKTKEEWLKYYADLEEDKAAEVEAIFQALELAESIKKRLAALAHGKEAAKRTLDIPNKEVALEQLEIMLKSDISLLDKAEAMDASISEEEAASDQAKKDFKDLKARLDLALVENADDIIKDIIRYIRRKP